MRFIDKTGQQIVTIEELFETKKFLKAINCCFYFCDVELGKEEKWVFIDNLSEHIPIDSQQIKEVISYCGWCKRIDK